VTVDPTVAREVWLLAEPYHAVAYFAPEVSEAWTDAGLKGFYMGYFAARAAPMGPVGPAVVEATFYVFHPDRVRRAIPDAWHYASPDAAMTARDEGVDAALGRLVGEVDADLAATARRVAGTLSSSSSGRPLFAAHADLPWPDSPRLALWHATTLLREHRGDGHVAVLTAAEVGPCEANVLAAARGAVDPQRQRESRQFSEGEWAAAADALARRGVVDAGGSLTDRGLELVAGIEQRTDELAAAGLRAADPADVDRLLAGLRPLAVAAAREIPFPNPIGLPPPA
jgi:hypothetical protein